MGPILFLLLYLLAMIPTYFARYAIIGATFDDHSTAEDIDVLSGVVLGFMFICYAILALLCYFRGKKANRPYLAAFPIIGGAFDLFLPFVILLPTGMNIVALILGVINPAPKPKE